MIDDVKELFQSFIAPQLEGIKGELVAINARIDAQDAKFEARFEALDTKFEALDTKFEARFEAIDTRFEALDMKFGTISPRMEAYRGELLAQIQRVEETLSADFIRLESKVDLRLASMDEKLDLFRRELLAEIRASKN